MTFLTLALPAVALTAWTGLLSAENVGSKRTSRPVTLPKKYKASGEVKCSTGKDSLEKWCAFRVVRKSGTADIWLEVAPGKTHHYRLLHFAQSRFFDSAGAAADCRRVDDNWLVSVENEFYFIPDALIYGG